jgi:ArsR family transcriptional regulator
VAAVRGSVLELPFGGGAFDGVTSFDVIYHQWVKDDRAAVAEMARVLKPGGRAVVLDLLRHDREEFRLQMGQQGLGFEPSELVRLMEQSGLPGAACRELAPEPGAKGPALVLATGERPPAGLHPVTTRVPPEGGWRASHAARPAALDSKRRRTDR